MDNTLIITLLVFMSSFFAVMAVFMFIRSGAERKDLLEKIQREGIPAAVEDHETTAAEPTPSASLLIRLSMRLGNLIKPKDDSRISRSRLRFLRAGYRHRKTPIVFLGLQLLLASALPVAFYLVQVLYLRMPPFQAILVAVTLALFGFSLPDLWVKMMISRRKEKITEGFPDALDLLVVCVEAGMGLDSAVSRVASEMEMTNRPISEEFHMLNMEMRAGRTRRDALKSLSARVDLEDISSFVTLLVQTDRFGTSVGPALRVHSDSMRTKRHQRAEERAAKIPTKLVFPLLFFIFPSMFIIFLAPPLIQLFRMWKAAG